MGYKTAELRSRGEKALAEYIESHEPTLSFPFSGHENEENNLIMGKYIILISIINVGILMLSFYNLCCDNILTNYAFQPQDVLPTADFSSGLIAEVSIAHY